MFLQGLNHNERFCARRVKNRGETVRSFGDAAVGHSALGAAAPVPLSPETVGTPFTNVRAAEQAGSALWRSLSEHSLTIAQFMVLRDLDEHPGSGVFDVADRTGMDRATTGPLVRRLEIAGLVHRQSSRRDRRRVDLHLLSPARQALSSADSALRQVDRELIAPLEESRRKPVLGFWAALTEDVHGELASGSTSSPYLIIRAVRRRQRRIWSESVSSTLSSSQFAMLRAIEAAPGCELRTAARQAVVEETTAVRMVMRLARTHYVLDQENPADRRKSSLYVAPSATEELAAMTLACERAEAVFLGPLASSDRAEAVAAMATAARE